MILELMRYKNQPPIEVVVDKSDYKRLNQYKWFITNGYVATRMINGKMTYLHRFILNTPTGMVTDHINHNKLDNRKANLRACTSRENTINSSLSKNNTTSFRGTSFERDRSKYSAYIFVNRKKIHLGRYENLKDAIEARLAGEKKYFGIYAPSGL